MNRRASPTFIRLREDGEAGKSVPVRELYRSDRATNRSELGDAIQGEQTQTDTHSSCSAAFSRSELSEHSKGDLEPPRGERSHHAVRQARRGELRAPLAAAQSSPRLLPERVALSLLPWEILQRGRGWKQGESRGSYCTALSQAEPRCRGLARLPTRVAQPPRPVRWQLPCPRLPEGSMATGGCWGRCCPTAPLSPGHLPSISSPHFSLRQMQQLFSLFRLQQKPLQAHKGEEQKRGPGLNKSHLPGARAPRATRVLPPGQPRSGEPKALQQKYPQQTDFEEVTLQSGSSVLDAEGKATGAVGTAGNKGVGRGWGGSSWGVLQNSWEKSKRVKPATRWQHEAPLMTWGTSSRLEVVVNEEN